METNLNSRTWLFLFIPQKCKKLGKELEKCLKSCSAMKIRKCLLKVENSCKPDDDEVCILFIFIDCLCPKMLWLFCLAHSEVKFLKRRSLKTIPELLWVDFTPCVFFTLSAA